MVNYKKIFMKKILLLAIAVVTSIFAVAQTSNGKVGYINTEEILNKIPEYTLAQDQLTKLGEQYNNQVEAEFKKIEILYNNYQSSKASMSAQLREQRENEIIAKEKAARDMQNNFFGQDGRMQVKTEELLTPIKNKIQNAIDKVAQNGNFMLIFDIAGMQGVAYSNPSDNLNYLVLKILGY